MRRETRDELLLGFLAINAMLREEIHSLKRMLGERITETKYNPNWAKQPRSPRGTPIGGQWVSAGQSNNGPKQFPQVRPAAEPEPQPQRPQPQRLPVATNDNAPMATNDNSLLRLPLRASPVAAITFPLSLSGSTPQPRSEARHITDDLVLVITESQGRRGATFHRVVAPERQMPVTLLGIHTGLTTTQHAELEHLYVYAIVEGDDVVFDRSELELAYGQEIPGISGPQEEPRTIPLIVPLTEEERRLNFNLRHLGASDEQINHALQALRNNESDGDWLVSELERSGASRRQIENIRRHLRLARRDRPYRPPASGPLLAIFPELASAPGDRMVYPADGWADVSPSIRRSERSARASANALVREIRALDPNYVAPNLNDANLFPQTAEGRVAYIQQLQQERAAALFRVRGDLQPLQVETFRFMQRRVDAVYVEGARLYERGEITSHLGREHAIGQYIDRTLDRELRVFYQNLGISVDGELIRVHRGENISSSTWVTPDARVGDIYFDMSVSEKRPTKDQVMAFFVTRPRPRYVIIVRPRQRGRSYIITPPRNRYARD